MQTADRAPELEVQTWHCARCEATAVGIGRIAGLRAVGWNVEDGYLLCPRHRTDRLAVEIEEEVATLQRALGLTTVVRRGLAWLGTPNPRPPQPGEPDLLRYAAPGLTGWPDERMDDEGGR